MINFLTIKILLHKNGYTEADVCVRRIEKKNNNNNNNNKTTTTTTTKKTNRTTQKNVKIVTKFIQSQLLTNKYSKQNSKDKL